MHVLVVAQLPRLPTMLRCPRLLLHAGRMRPDSQRAGGGLLQTIVSAARYALALVAVCGASVLGCASPPPVEQSASINQIELASRVVLDGSEKGVLFRVFEIAPDGDGLRLTASDGALWIDRADNVSRRLEFLPRGRALFPSRSLRDGDVVFYAGFDSTADRVVIFDANGRESSTHPCRQCRELVVADLDGDGRESLVVRANDGTSATIFGDRGASTTTLSAIGYLTDIVATPLGGTSAAALLLYSSPDPELQKAVRVVRKDGTEIGKWPIAAQSAIVAATAAGGEPSVLSIDADAIVERDAMTGSELSRTTLDGASAFRELYAAWWRDGRRVFVLSGGGALNKHMVAVTDRKGKVLFREVGDRRAWALGIPSRMATSFYVAVGGSVMKYQTR